MNQNEVSVPCITCRGCHRPKFLPRQNPLEIFEDPPNPPKAEWPIVFVCTVCGLASEHSWPPDDNVALSAQYPDLWRIESVCDHKNCGRHRAIYSTYDAGVLEEDVRQILIRRSKPVPCNGHSFQLTAGTMREMKNFLVC
jgi:hypothetical protein